MNVDQTNESVIVGDQAVVKWAVHLQEGPHPAPQRITTLRDAGFTGIPQPWGVITWQAPNGEETVTAYVDEYLPGAVDGWTWAVEMMTAATLAADPDATAATARQLGVLVADMHAALASTASVATSADADRWHAAAFATLEAAGALDGSASARVVRARRADVAAELAILSSLTRLRQISLDPRLVDDEYTAREPSAKIGFLVDQLRELSAEGHRALVFSQFTRFLGKARDRAERAVALPLRLALASLQRALQPQTITQQTLPPELVRDWLAPDGQALVNLGLILGLLQFVTTFVITGLYVRFANRELDPRAGALREQLESEIK